MQVLDAKLTQSRISEEMSSIMDTVGASAEVADDVDPWTVVSLRKTLEFLCQDAPAYRQLLLDTVSSTGGAARHASVSLIVAQR